MKKISLNGVDTKKFMDLIKRSSSMDNIMFINVVGSEFEATAYNKNKSALKNVSADLEKLCNMYKNELGDDTVKIQISGTSKLIQVLNIVGIEDVNITFYFEDNNYCKKLIVENNEVSITIPCADKEAVDFLEIPETARFSIFEDTSKLQFKVNITESEFKYIAQLMNLNKTSLRVFFNKVGENVFLSEIEGTDENVRTEVNTIISDCDYVAFNNFEKLYNKKLNFSELENVSNTNDYIGCFTKKYFEWIDQDKMYTVEFHQNKIKFVSYDDDSCIKTYVVLTPVRFS